ncbi:hypothetical protein PFISCL1PPCAC_14918, partial [Pristionchus fissidentatus]
VISQSPPSFKHNGGVKVIEGGKYRIVCKDGFKFPPGTKAAQKNMQNVVCGGTDKGYLDGETNEKTKIESCERGQEPGCAPSIDASNLPSSKKLKKSDKCTTNNDRSSVGCKITVECAEGYYPKNPDMQIEKEQSLECKDNGTSSYWNDPKTNQIVSSMLECLPGCKDGQLGKNARFVRANGDKTTVGDTNFYNENAKVTVKCNDDSTYKYGDVTSTNPEMTYTCKGGADPWKNEDQSRLEKSPGDLCVRVCEAMETPAGLRITASPATRFVNGIPVVKADEKYSFTCANGYHYPPESSPAKNNNKQTLVCDNNSGKFVDGTTGEKTGPTLCVKDTGPGCPDIAQHNSKTTDECPQGNKGNIGCSVRVTCDKRYIPASPYDKDGKQILKCEDGNDWKDQFGNVVKSKLECKKACIVDDAKIGKVAKVTKNSGDTKNINNFVYVENGQVITVKCEGDGVVWKDNASETPKEHSYTCVGGNEGWKRDNDGQVVVNPGDGCVRTCKAPENIQSATAKLQQKPTIIDYSGQKLVADGAKFIYKCNENYAYPSTSPYNGMQNEPVVCNGATRNFESIKKKGNPFTKPEECERKKGLNECKIIPQDASKTVSQLVKCDVGEYVKTGCTVKVRCADGHYPKKVDYHTVLGDQEMICTSGGEGWRDQYNNIISDPLECIAGCLNRSSTSTDVVVEANNYISTTHKKATCKTMKLTVKSVANSTRYSCPVENPGEKTTDNGCTNSCKALDTNLPAGVVIEKAAEAFAGVPSFVFGDETYVFKCLPGYVYPSKSPHRPLGKQSLKCNGDYKTYDDMESGATDGKVEACEKAPGCKKPVLSDNSVTVTGPECWVGSDYLNDKCTVEIKCEPGYYPEDKLILYGDNVKLKCDESKEAWVDVKTGETKEDTKIKCIKGCVEIDPKVSREVKA